MDLLIGNETVRPSRIFCIGRNYVDHAKELKNEVPTSPVVFMKPATSLVPEGEAIPVPSHGEEFHFEAELVVLIGKEGRAVTLEQAPGFIKALSLGLDLTLRDVQSRLKGKGLPWECAKAFDGSAPLGAFKPIGPSMPLEEITFTCHVNDELRQSGNTNTMIFPIKTLVVELSRVWKLLPGDLIYTGTPSGVGPLNRGDRITVASPVIGSFSWTVASAT